LLGGCFDFVLFYTRFQSPRAVHAADEQAVIVVQPTLRKFRAPAGSYLIKRYGKPGAKQERVEIGIVDTPQAK